MLFVPSGPEFQWSVSNVTGQATAASGTAITPNISVGSYGSWARVLSAASVTQDIYGVLINFNSGGTSAATRNILCEMGVDNTGGSTYNTKIPYLIAGNCIPHTTAPGGIWYYFPLFIKAGSSIAFRAMSNSATSFRARITCYGQPRQMEGLRVGTYVDAFGWNTTSRTGTSITPGTTSEGTWVQLGTTTRSYWWWQAGLDIVSTAINAAVTHVDIAAGTSTNKKLLLENQVWYSTTSETVGNIPMTISAYNNTVTGDIIYGRAQTNLATSITGLVAYGLGG